MSPIISLVSLIAGNPVFISSVEARPANGHYELHIRGESPLEPQQLSGRVDGRRVTLYVSGGRARSENRAWGTGEDRVKAFRHKDRLELEGRLPELGCAGAVNVAAGAGGSVVARVTCATLRPAASATKPTRPEQAVDAQPMQQAPSASTAAQALIDAVALAPQADAKAANGEGAALLAAADEAPARSATSVRQQTPPAEAAKPGEPTTADEAAAEASGAPHDKNPHGKSRAAEAPTTASIWGVVGKTLLPILLLAGAAFAALKFSRRRRQLGRHVRILETTTLGPRRSLIVAKVGNETLLLGSSEAGISLIQVRPVDQDTHEREDDVDEDVSRKKFTKSAVDESDDDGLWVDAMDIKGAVSDESPEAGQVKMLARLFRKRRQDVPEAWPFANVLDASLMEESVEDRELREKLALGMEARVP